MLKYLRMFWSHLVRAVKEFAIRHEITPPLVFGLAVIALFLGGYIALVVADKFEETPAYVSKMAGEHGNFEIRCKGNKVYAYVRSEDPELRVGGLRDVLQFFKENNVEAVSMDTDPRTISFATAAFYVRERGP